MKTIANTFLKGLVFTLPIVITFGLIYWLFVSAEDLLRIPLEWMLPSGWYMPGMGVVSALIIIFVHGILVQAYLINKLFSWLESLVGRIPFVNTLYGSAKDLLRFVAGDKSQNMQKVVAITLDNNIKMIGFVTNEDVTLGDQKEQISIYVPLSYQIGGFLLYLPKSRCEPLDLSVKQAMQLVLTANVVNNNSD
ncbi:DUF502 domain-containing protein [Aurantivibrio infirmus]